MSTDQPPSTSTDLLDAPPVDPPTAFGTYATRGPVACDPEATESQVDELRSGLERRGKTSPDTRQTLLELWLDIEPFLTPEERASLGNATFERIFPDAGTPRPNRCGQASHGGA